MKKLFIIATALLTTFSCGTSYESNKSIGEIPYVYAWAENEINQLSEDFNNDKISHEKFTAKVTQVETTLAEDLQKAFEKVKGNDVFLNWANGFEGKNIEISSAKVTDFNVSSGAITVNVMFKATKDHVVGKDVFRYLVILEGGKAVMELGFNPYTNALIVSNSAIPYGKEIKAGEYTCENGTNLMLYPKSYDLSNFSMIMVVNR
ncbi:MAG: hypothetical protein R3Y51_05270 [Rikenellaceae bacterium]